MDLLSRLKKLSDNPAPNQTFLTKSSLLVGAAFLTIRSKVSENDKSVPSTNEAQQQWKPPDMVEPDIEEEFPDDQKRTDLGTLATDAKLFLLKIKRNGKCERHSVLKLPSSLPRKEGINNQSSDIFNILFVDVSASMVNCWSAVQSSWNKHVAPRLKGRTAVYTFGSSVSYRREGTTVTLDKTDFDGGGTDLTGALQTLINEIYVCKQRYVNIFMITDGDHNTTDVDPRNVIDQIQSPLGKVCSVYILGVGRDFPVHYSVQIRSRLHNGSSNVPSLFWAVSNSHIEDKMAEISNILCDGSSLTLKLEIPGASMPGLSDRYVFHLREWVYFYCDPNNLKTLQLKFGNHSGSLELEPQEASFEVLEEIFRQWNSVIIQRNSKRESVPRDIFRFMEEVFVCLTDTSENAKSQSLSHRRQIKMRKTQILAFRKEVQKVKTILTTSKFENQLELAENILSTTVTVDKYKIKYLKYKGHTDTDFKEYVLEFEKVCSQHLKTLQSLPVTPDDCCRITMTSTLSDLQDADFLTFLKESEKFEFLKEFTITGIPVKAPIRDSIAMNPWSFSVRSTLKSPYTIMSQVAMESFAELKQTHGSDKMVQLKDDDENTRFNAIVPVFSPSVAKAMQQIVSTRLYTMCVTFAILKNPHIMDFDIHMASLAVTWVFCLYENPTIPRPEHVLIRMESLEATAQLYTNFSRYAKYMKVLLESPAQALMTESTEKFEGKSIKCESMIKPMFLFHMCKKYTNSVNLNKVTEIVRLILLEYVGRCLSSYKSPSGTPYSDIFAESLADQAKKKELVKNFVSEARASIAGSEHILLEDFYTFEKASKAAKIIAKEDLKKEKDKLMTKIPLRVKVNKIENLKNVSNAGDVSWSTLRLYAKEMGLNDGVIDQLFSEDSIFIYTAHALQYRASRERLSNLPKSYSSSHKFVADKVQEESTHNVFVMFHNDFVTSLENSWLKAYFAAHTEVVKPMSRQQIINEAQSRGINVTNDTFDLVYRRYRPNTGLLGNACQSRSCPYFLQPNKMYNQHAVVERKKGPVHFVHGLHIIAHIYRDRAVATAKMCLEYGPDVKTPSLIPKQIWKKVEPELRRLQFIYQETAQLNSSGM